MESTPGDQIGATIGTGNFTKRYIYIYGLVQYNIHHHSHVDFKFKD